MNQFAKARLYHTADKSRLVPEGHDEAAFLYANEGDEIPADACTLYGLKDGAIAAVKSETAAEKKARAEADKQAQADADKQAQVGADKQAQADADKQAQVGADKQAGATENKAN